ncbi:hypothetical protein C8A05DRAFT_12093 [Staphylotrichum tortipilum]|uniref:Uncharacterized protein n=1 Tax=Staphylotrichum tortipilum TaxID=2831512 RepID=A0AAN6MSI6_9PEZI|nr:hypothetical protein C8A05DRAFT_12093 [Staphylotrichum longicolle]
MKLVSFLAFFLGIAMALETLGLEKRQGRPYRRITAPIKPIALEERASEYAVSTGTPTEHRSKAVLTKVQSLGRRRDITDTTKTPRRQAKATDFFECTNPKLKPSSADCKVIVNQVLSTDDEIIIAPNSCLVFSFRTCQAFFCSLCATLDTSTSFIGGQLDTVDALCVESGQAGAIVGEDAPQWDAGFTYAGQALPAYDVC